MVQGKSDPIMPYQESEDIGWLLRGKGRTVDYLLLSKEGHGLSQEEDYFKALDRVVALLQPFTPSGIPP